MSSKIFQTIINFTKNYKDPESNSPFDENNSKIQIVEKNGNVNISLTINDKYLIPLNIDSNYEYIEMFTKNDDEYINSEIYNIALDVATIIGKELIL